MLRQHLTTIIQRLSSNVLPSNPFEQFISHKDPLLQTKRTSGRNVNSQDIFVSCNPVSRDHATQFMEKKGIVSKTVLVNVDPSHLIGIRRLVSKKHMQQNVYKGYGQVVDILNKQNPSQFLSPEQIEFNSSLFFQTDPYYTEQIKKNSSNSEKIMEDLSQLYENDRQRGGARLSKQYSVPPEYIPIIEAAHNLKNKIYFIGLNEFNLRQIICSFLKINQIKALFMESLKYTCSELQQQEQIQKYWKHKNKEYLWLQYYNYLQPINYQQIKSFKRKVKGYYFAHPYLFDQPQNPQINLSTLKDTHSDSDKIQKNAILSVLYGNIWKNAYTNNPFPYLAEFYLDLQNEDKQLVLDLYNQHFRKYSSARDNFIQQKKYQKQQRL